MGNDNYEVKRISPGFFLTPKTYNEFALFLYNYRKFGMVNNLLTMKSPLSIGKLDKEFTSGLRTDQDVKPRPDVARYVLSLKPDVYNSVFSEYIHKGLVGPLGQEGPVGPVGPVEPPTTVEEYEAQVSHVKQKSAIKEQVGGGHYKSMAFQPIELSYLINASPAFTKVAKYTTRVKDDMQGQLDKAKHCIELEMELIKESNTYSRPPLNSVEKDLMNISKFTQQFKHGTALYGCLVSLYLRQYDEAKDYLDLYRTKLERL